PSLARRRPAAAPARLYAVRSQLVLQLPLRVTPSVAGGVGRVLLRSDALGDDEDTDLHLGAGLKVFITPRLHVRVDGRLYRGNRGDGDGGDVNHFAVNGGLAISFGGVGRPVPPDRDGDGVPDARDRCPAHRGTSADGCPAQDADGDGMPDDVDQCPGEVETVNGHLDTDGCPDELPDEDGDGLRGGADSCPTEPEDIDGFEDDDGCPDPDNDGDGLVDAADACPDAAGPAENKGCPDKDRDGDGIVDRLD